MAGLGLLSAMSSAAASFSALTGFSTAPCMPASM